MTDRTRSLPAKLARIAAAALALSGCAVGPNYQRPALPGTTPATWKADPGWRPANPSDAGPKGAWWRDFRDPVLDTLQARIPAANQTVAAAIAALDQARGLTRTTRAGLFPTVGLSGGVTRSSGNSVTTGIGTGGDHHQPAAAIGPASSSAPTPAGRPTCSARSVARSKSTRASERASAADLGNVLLIAQSDLANNYLQLRALDAQADLYHQTVRAYRRALEITTNRYRAGVSAKSDVLQAQTQLSVAAANLTDTARNRAVFENAVAVLVGENPSTFRIAPARWTPVTPDVPAVLPATLTERRPDVAAAERRVAAANAQIGVQLAAFFPTVGLSASGSTNAGSVGALFGASANLWSLGVSVAQTLLDFGARRGRVEQARAAWRQAVAIYRQTALTAFGEVENQLTALRVLAVEERQRADASRAADQAEAIALNQYKAGQIAFTDVIIQQTAALNARLTLVAATRDRQFAAVGLAQALGGGWMAG